MFNWLTDTDRYIPHGMCLAWDPATVATMAASDGLIALSYFALPVAIWVFASQRKDLLREHRRVAALFVLFIAACGTTHVLDVITLWTPIYGVMVAVKLVTAAASVATALFVWPLLPKLLALPSRAELERANAALVGEVAAHQATLRELEDARARLEQRFGETSDELAVSVERFELALGGSGVTAFEQDSNLVYRWCFNSGPGETDEAVVGRTDADLHAPESARALEALKREVLEAGTPRTAELPIERDGQTYWFRLALRPTVRAKGEQVLFCAATDITPLKDQEARLRLVLRELTHRSKNLMGVVQSIARQTAKSMGLPREFSERLGERLRSLGTAQDLLVDSDWQGATLGGIVDAQLAHFTPEIRARIAVTDSGVRLSPSLAQYLALAVHELSTNSLKYGALSTERGTASIESAANGDEGLKIVWREQGGPGPELDAKAGAGFGRLLLERLIPQSVGGQASWLATGGDVEWVLTAPPVAA
jgi:PAS domain S-box-containing protein